MQVTVETKEGLEREVTVQVPAERIDSAVSERLNSLTKSVKLKGFRPGKVPYKVVQKRFGAQVRQEVMGEVLRSSFQEAVAQENLQPAGFPRFEPRASNVGEQFEYVATFEIYPEFELSSVAELELEQPIASVTDTDLDDMIEYLRRQRAEWKGVDRAAVEGDRLRVDYLGTIDGEKFEGGSAEDSPIVLGSANLVEGFENQLIGAKAGEARTISVNFPADYHAEGLAGKAVQFDVKVHAVEESELPEIDHEFVSSLGVKEGGIEALRTEIRKSMERELEQAIHARMKRHVMDALVQANTLDLPSTLVRQENERLQQQMAERLPKGTDASALSGEQFDGEARRRVKLGLVISAIVKQNDIKAAPDKVRAAIESIAAPYQDPREVVNYYYGNRELLSSVEALVLEDEIVAWALRSAQVTEKPLSFKELTGSASGTTAG